MSLTKNRYITGTRAKYGKDILDNDDILNEYLQSKNNTP